MKILAVHGSPRNAGNTETLIKEALRGAGEPDADVYAVNDLSMMGCQGCMGCRVEGSDGCVVDDAMQDLYPKLLEADAVIMGSPVYYGEITGQMKAFMDRWYALRDFERKLRIKSGKKALFIVTQGADRPDWYKTVTERLDKVLEKYGMDVEVLVAPGLEGKSDAASRPELMKAAFDAGKRLKV